VKIKYIISFIIVALLQTTVCVYAIEETPHLQTQIGISSAVDKKLVSKIEFDDIWDKAKEHSYDLKIADFNILISKQGIRNARSEYFPKLNLSAGTEYTKNYRDQRESTVMSIGESFINPYTRYQSIFGITINYNLFDFGVRKGNLDIAKEDVALKELQEREKLQELNLTVIDTYTKALIFSKQIELNKQILELAKKNLELKERLFNAKEISKTELNDAIVEVADSERKVDELYGLLAETLNWLTFYTGEEYDIEHLKVADVKKPDFDIMEYNDYTKSVTWLIHEKELKKKELELKVAKRNYCPKVNAYGRYYIYGSDQVSYNDSLGDIRPSNFTVGGSIYMPVFDGFKNSSNVQRLILEVKQLQVERDKAIAEFMTKLATMRTNLMYLDKQIYSSEISIKELSDKEKSMNRLYSKKLVTPMDLNEAKIKLLQQKIEYEKNKITFVAIMKAIQALTTY
jgi:outer membrane protein